VDRDILSTPSSGEHAFVMGALRVASGHFRTQLIVAWSPTESSSISEVQRLAADPYYHRRLPLDEMGAHAMQANVLLADAIPDLRIIMDHLPSFDPTPENQLAYEAVVKEMAARPNIFVKLTEVYHPQPDGTVRMDYEPLRARLEYLYNIFGEDRVMFGTDYPNSYGVATIPQEVSLMKQFFSTKSRGAAEKYFWKNSARIYKWIKRTPQQPSLV
jgi:predicted TIM-barrel fold metal-dependent hydrolase